MFVRPNCHQFLQQIVCLAATHADGLHSKRRRCAFKEPGAPAPCEVPSFWRVGLVAHPQVDFTIAECEPRQHPPQEARRQARAPGHLPDAARNRLGPILDLHTQVKVVANARQPVANFVVASVRAQFMAAPHPNFFLFIVCVFAEWAPNGPTICTERISKMKPC